MSDSVLSVTEMENSDPTDTKRNRLSYNIFTIILLRLRPKVLPSVLTRERGRERKKRYRGRILRW